MRELRISAGVAGYLGDEILDQINAYLIAGCPAECFDCGDRVGEDEPAAAIVLLAPPGVQESDRALVTHPRCRASGVYQLSAVAPSDGRPPVPVPREIYDAASTQNPWAELDPDYVDPSNLRAPPGDRPPGK